MGRSNRARKARLERKLRQLQEEQLPGEQLQRGKLQGEQKKRLLALHKARCVYDRASGARNGFQAKLQVLLQSRRNTDDAAMNEKHRHLLAALKSSQRNLEQAWARVRSANIEATGRPGRYVHPDAGYRLRDYVERSTATARHIDLTEDNPPAQIQGRPEMIQPSVHSSIIRPHKLKQEPLAFDAAALRTIERIGLNSTTVRNVPRGLSPLIKREEQTSKTPVISGSFPLNRAELHNNKEAQRPLITFGMPSVPLPVLRRTVWTEAKPKAAVNSILDEDRSLEDLYRDYPEKRLRGIEPETLGLVADTVHQVAKEAADNWLKSACPGTRWNDSIVNVAGLYDFRAPELDYTILDRAMALQQIKKIVVLQLAGLRTLLHDTKFMTPLILLRVLDQSIAICQIVKDNKRRVLLEKAKQKFEWLPVRLDCKKLDIHRRANQAIRDAYNKHRRDMILSRHFKDQVEVQILDRALVEFQEHRLVHLIDMLRTLEQLLEATA